MFSSKDQQSEIKLLEKIEKIHSKFEQSLASLISNLFEKQIPMIRNEMNQEIKELILKYSKENKYYPTNEKKPIDIREYRSLKEENKKFEKSSMDAIKKRLYLNQNNDSKPNNNDSRINMSVKTPTPILNKSRANDYELSLKRRCEKILLSSSSSASSEVEIEVQKNKNKLNFKKKEEISNSKFSSDRNKEISKNKNGDLLDLEYKKFIEMKKNKFSKKSSMHNNDSFSD